MTTPTLGLALIAKDEEATLANLLASVEGAFDQVALLDTGSTDRTVEVFEEWAEAEKSRHPGFVSTLGHFDWCDDFAAARNAADALLKTDWLCWADCDDEIVGAENLREIVATASDPVTWFSFTYRPLGIEGAEPSIRDRISRRGFERWGGRVHENWAHEGFPRPGGKVAVSEAIAPRTAAPSARLHGRVGPTYSVAGSRTSPGT